MPGNAVGEWGSLDTRRKVPQSSLAARADELIVVADVLFSEIDAAFPEGSQASTPAPTTSAAAAEDPGDPDVMQMAWKKKKPVTYYCVVVGHPCI